MVSRTAVSRSPQPSSMIRFRPASTPVLLEWRQRPDARRPQFPGVRRPPLPKVSVENREFAGEPVPNARSGPDCRGFVEERLAGQGIGLRSHDVAIHRNRDIRPGVADLGATNHSVAAQGVSRAWIRRRPHLHDRRRTAPLCGIRFASPRPGPLGSDRSVPDRQMPPDFPGPEVPDDHHRGREQQPDRQRQHQFDRRQTPSPMSSDLSGFQSLHQIPCKLCNPG
jgi:hypothetical protein